MVKKTKFRYTNFQNKPSEKDSFWQSENKKYKLGGSHGKFIIKERMQEIS